VGSLPIIALVAVGMRVLLLYQIRLAEVLGFGRPSLVRICACLMAVCPLGIIIHECGHWAAGAALGLRCRRFVAGPVEWRRGGGWRLRWPLRQAGGIDMGPSTRAQRALCVAGGPLASLTAGLVCLALARAASTSAWYWGWSFSALWALVGLVGIVPMRRGERRSDGLLLWDLLRGAAPR